MGFRHVANTPAILVGKMWRGLIEWARGAMLSAKLPLARAEDMNISHCAAKGDEEIALLRASHKLWLARQAAFEAGISESEIGFKTCAFFLVDAKVFRSNSGS